MRNFTFVAAMAALLALSAAATACTLPADDVDIDLQFEGLTPQGGAPLIIQWSAPARPEGCGGRLYLLVDFPSAMRFFGDGFVALLPGDEGPFAEMSRADRLRIVLPLEGQGPWGGQIEATPHLLGPVDIGTQLLHADTSGDGLSEVALATIIAPGPSHRLEVSPGRPRIVAQEAAPIAVPDTEAISADGRYRLLTFEENFTVTHIDTEALVVSGRGLAPRFSPTGRFLHWFPSGFEAESGWLIGEDFVLFDLAAETVTLRLDDVPLRGAVPAIQAVDWSPGDGLMLLHVGGNCGLALVQPLIQDRVVFSASGPTACDGPGFGLAVTSPALDAVYLGALDAEIKQPLLRKATAEEADGYDFLRRDPPDEDGDFRLAGGAVSSFSPPGLRSVPVLAEPAQAVALPRPAAAGLGVSRGAGAIDPAPLTDRPSDALTGPLSERLAALGIETLDPEAGPEWVEIKTEALPAQEDDLAEPADYDGAFLLATGQQSGLDLPGEAAAVLDALSRRIIPETQACAYGFPPEVTIWTQTVDETVMQIVHAFCIVGTGALREGVAALLYADATGGGGGVILAATLLGDPSYYEDAPSPTFDQFDFDVSTFGTWRLWPLTDTLFALSSPPDGLILVDADTGNVALFKDADADFDALGFLAITSDLSQIVQGNLDGRIIVRDRTSGRRTASGAYLDDELVLETFDGAFRWTSEGARHARVKFAGDPAAYTLDQLAQPAPDGTFSIPPALVVPDEQDDGLAGPLAIGARATAGLTGLEIYRDGRLVETRPLTGDFAELTLDLPPGWETTTVVARDRNGARSLPVTFRRPVTSVPPAGRLLAIAVGTDRYEEPAFASLTQAVRDARTFGLAMEAAPATRFAEVVVERFEDDPMMPARLPDRLAELAQEASTEDTLFLQISGHGFMGPDGQFYLAGTETRLSDPEATALPWARLQLTLAAFPGRVIVFLDACHSGSVDDGAAIFATNDDALDAMEGNERIAVVAASKGRQLSRENAETGGFFTSSVVAALGDPATDVSGDGVLDLDEIYAAAKGRTIALSKGQQTPWLVRNGLGGPVPLW